MIRHVAPSSTTRNSWQRAPIVGIGRECGSELDGALQLPQQYARLDASGVRERWCFYLAPQPHERLVHSDHVRSICQIGHICERRR
jgi:hypothetical protein